MTHPTLRNRFYLLCRRLKRLGIRGAIAYHLSRLVFLATRNKRPDPATSTSRTIPGDLRISSPNRAWGLSYAPSREDIFRKAIAQLPVDISQYIFADIGAGEGLMLLIAAEYPFKKVFGIEYSETLAAIAARNTRNHYNAMQKCMDIECICADATEFELPGEPIILYLYNPFQGKAMDRMIHNIERSLGQHQRDLWIIYVNPWEHRKFCRSSVLQTASSNFDELNWEFCIYHSLRSAN